MKSNVYSSISNNDIDVRIEIPAYSDPVKYEMDKDTGTLRVDRFLSTPMHYPCNYGFIPKTLAEDGDPVDVLLISDFQLLPLSIISSRPVGVLIMEDEKGMDEKVLSVPSDKLNSEYRNIKSYKDFSEILLNKITYFFERYKDLEKNKWAKVKNFEGVEKAYSIISTAIDKYNR